jgi:hypothetical protein
LTTQLTAPDSTSTTLPLSMFLADSFMMVSLRACGGRLLG